MTNRILLTDGSSTLLGANGTDHILLASNAFMAYYSIKNNSEQATTIL